MAELPEIFKLAGQMNGTLRGKTVKTVTILQEKCSNIPVAEFKGRVEGAVVESVRHKGKWIITRLGNSESILLSLGMGADILFFEDEKNEQEKYQIKTLYCDGSGYTARFWWFGKYLLANENELASEPNTKGIAIDPYDADFTPDYFKALLSGKKTQVKTFIMDQKNVGGIGNMYMHDILFKARLHPQKKISDMDGGEVESLYDSITGILNLSREKNAFAYESDFFGKKGGYSMSDFLVGYKENQPCPVCGANITLIKTGSTSSFICPVCQVL